MVIIPLDCAYLALVHVNYAKDQLPLIAFHALQVNTWMLAPASPSVLLLRL